MKSISKIAALLSLAGAFAGAAHAVQDLPGRPGVRQLNLHAAATRIAVEQSWLHWFMLITCVVIFIAGVLGDVLFDLEAPQVGGPQAGQLPRVGDGRSDLDHHPLRHRDRMALPATKVLVASKDTSNADVTIKATGYQWKWGYDYLAGEGQGVSFLSTLDARTARCPTTAPRPPTCPTTTC
jgi:cytochrome c oxidase subunit 2